MTINDQPIPTVKVKREGGKGYRIINASSFDPKVHELAEGEKKPKADKTTAAKDSKEPVKDGYQEVDYGDFTKADLLELLGKRKGVEFDPKGNKDSLIKALQDSDRKKYDEDHAQ